MVTNNILSFAVTTDQQDKGSMAVPIYWFVLFILTLNNKQIKCRMTNALTISVEVYLILTWAFYLCQWSFCSDRKVFVLKISLKWKWTLLCNYHFLIISSVELRMPQIFTFYTNAECISVQINVAVIYSFLWCQVSWWPSLLCKVLVSKRACYF